MTVLGVDTSGVSASVAIVGEGRLLAEHTPSSAVRLCPPPSRPGHANHSEVLLPLIACVLEDQGLTFSDLAALGVAIGPGSFTGLRIGLSVVKGLAYGSNVPVFGVRTLAAMAYRVPSEVKERFVCSFMDARKGQVYAALYRWHADDFTLVMKDTLDTPENVLKRVHALTTAGCVFIGEGTRTYGDLIEDLFAGRALLTTGGDYSSTASGVAQIAEKRLVKGEQDPLHTLMPDYLRPPDAVPPKSRTAASERVQDLRAGRR